ncbi:MAG: urease accessory protein UreD [Pseudomonadota bacterium]
MFDAGLQSELQRARGRGEVSFAGRPTRLTRLAQEGCAKILLPKTYGRPPEAVIVNTSGGITGGDRLRYAASVGPAAAATLTTQAAERVYRAATGEGRIEVRLEVGAEGRLDWLPQETILFEGGRLARTLEVDLSEGADVLIVESVILGRGAMGEVLEDAALTDQWRVRREGRLVFAEALRLAPPLSALRGPGALRDARAFATVALISDRAEDRLTEARAALPEGAMASAWRGALVCRFLDADPARLRRGLAAFLTQFNGPLPRVWQV